MIVGEYGLGLSGLDARIGGASDIESERDVSGTLERGRGEQRRSQRKAAIEVEFGAAERRIKACRRRGGREPVGHAPFQCLAIDLGFESIDGDARTAERNGATP